MCFTKPRSRDMFRSMKHITLFLTILLGAILAGGSARADISWSGTLSGLNEVPPNGSPATGFLAVMLTGDSLTVDLTWTGLVGGNPAAAHIHCCTTPGNNIGVAIGFTGFPAVTSGTYMH